MASALETLCGQAYGAKQYSMLGIYLQRSWIVLFICSVLLLPMFVFAAPFLKFIGQPTELADQAGLVAIWLIPFHLSFPFQFTLQRFLQSQLMTGVIALVSGCTLVAHVVVNWIFVSKMRVGIVGNALILDFSWWLSVLGMFIYARRLSSFMEWFISTGLYRALGVLQTLSGFRGYASVCRVLLSIFDDYSLHYYSAS